MDTFPLCTGRVPKPRPFRTPTKRHVSQKADQSYRGDDGLSRRRCPENPQQSIFYFFIQTFVRSKRFISNNSRFRGLANRRRLTKSLSEVFNIVIFTRLDTIGIKRCHYDRSRTTKVFINVRLILPLLTCLFLTNKYLRRKEVFFLNRNTSLGQGEFTVYTRGTLKGSGLLFFHEGDKVRGYKGYTRGRCLLSITRVSQIKGYFRAICLNMTRVRIVIRRYFIIIRSKRQGLANRRATVVTRSLVTRTNHKIIINSNSVGNFRCADISVLRRRVNRRITTIKAGMSVTNTNLHSAVNLFLRHTNTSNLRIQNLGTDRDLSIFRTTSLYSTTVADSNSFTFNAIRNILYGRVRWGPSLQRVRHSMSLINTTRNFSHRHSGRHILNVTLLGNSVNFTVGILSTAKYLRLNRMLRSNTLMLRTTHVNIIRGTRVILKRLEVRIINSNITRPRNAIMTMRLTRLQDMNSREVSVVLRTSYAVVNVRSRLTKVSNVRMLTINRPKESIRDVKVSNINRVLSMNNNDRYTTYPPTRLLQNRNYTVIRRGTNIRISSVTNIEVNTTKFRRLEVTTHLNVSPLSRTFRHNAHHIIHTVMSRRVRLMKLGNNRRYTMDQDYCRTILSTNRNDSSVNDRDTNTTPIRPTIYDRFFRHLNNLLIFSLAVRCD